MLAWSQPRPTTAGRRGIAASRRRWRTRRVAVSRPTPGTRITLHRQVARCNRCSIAAISADSCACRCNYSPMLWRSAIGNSLSPSSASRMASGTLAAPSGRRPEPARIPRSRLTAARLPSRCYRIRSTGWMPLFRRLQRHFAMPAQRSAPELPAHLAAVDLVATHGRTFAHGSAGTRCASAACAQPGHGRRQTPARTPLCQIDGYATSTHGLDCSRDPVS